MSKKPTPKFTSEFIDFCLDRRTEPTKAAKYVTRQLERIVAKARLAAKARPA